MALSNDKRLYRLTIPRDSQQGASDRANRNFSAQGAITSGVSPVENVSVQPGQKSLEGQYRGEGADRMAQQLTELFGSDDIGTVAFFEESGSDEEDGYYLLGSIDSERPDARQKNLVSFTGDMTREGTRQSHYRNQTFTVTEVDNEFGNTQSATVGVPAGATQVFWFDTVSGDRQVATEDSTVEAEAVFDLANDSAVTRNVDLYDVDANPYGDDGTLCYDLPYDEEGIVDCGVWDTRSASVGDKIGQTTDGASFLNWQRVFVQDHDFRGNPVMENGRVSMEFDLSNDTIDVQEWNDGTQSWDNVSLGTANGWSPFDVDFTEVGEVAVRAQVTFEDTDDGSLYPLNFTLVRGRSRPLITIPENEGDPLPADLNTYLTPLADDETFDPQTNLGLIQRSEVRK